jgi:hypothetical protein
MKMRRSGGGSFPRVSCSGLRERRPELNRHGDATTHHALPARQTGQHGFETNPLVSASSVYFPLLTLVGTLPFKYLVDFHSVNTRANSFRNSHGAEWL